MLSLIDLVFHPKDLRMNPKRWPFALQKTTFYRLKGHVLQAKRRHIGKYLTAKQLADAQRTAATERPPTMPFFTETLVRFGEMM